jgi:hypothetical protein
MMPLSSGGRCGTSGLGWSIVPDLEPGDAAQSGVGHMELPDKIVLGISYKRFRFTEQAMNFLAVARSFIADGKPPLTAPSGQQLRVEGSSQRDHRTRRRPPTRRGNRLPEYTIFGKVSALFLEKGAATIDPLTPFRPSLSAWVLSQCRSK